MLWHKNRSKLLGSTLIDSTHYGFIFFARSWSLHLANGFKGAKGKNREKITKCACNVVCVAHQNRPVGERVRICKFEPLKSSSPLIHNTPLSFYGKMNMVEIKTRLTTLVALHRGNGISGSRRWTATMQGSTEMARYGQRRRG